MRVVLTNLQKVLLTLQPVDAAGNPAPVDGPPTWALSDPSFLTLELAPDAMSAYAITTGAVGLSMINFSADADLGEGIVTIAGSLEVEVIGSQAVTLGVLVGTPEPK